MSEASILRFAGFELDPSERRLTGGGRTLDLQGRYFDALLLLARNPGRLVSKDRFLDEVWNGVPVTDEALTQCIRTIRRTLDDKSSHPRFIETVPRHGYRFIAEVEGVARAEPIRKEASQRPRGVVIGQTVATIMAVLLGGGVAGAIGGICYGFLIASQSSDADVGSASILLLITGLTVIASLVGALGVGLGFAFAAARPSRNPLWLVPGGAVGGLIVGGLVKMVSLDAYKILIGRVPGEFTGAAEGFVLGGGTGLAAAMAIRLGGFDRAARSLGAATAIGAAAGAIIPLLGLRLMGGSLDHLAKLSLKGGWTLDTVGRIFGESGFGQASAIGTAALEGALFAACVTAALLVVRDQVEDG